MSHFASALSPVESILTGEITTLRTNGNRSDAFGQTVSTLDDGRILVGAPFVSSGANYSGAVYVFDPAVPTSPLLTLPNPTPALFDRFGSALLGVGNSTVLVGAESDDHRGPDAGAVHVLDATNGALIRTIFSPIAGGGNLFGRSLEWMGGTNVAIGAPGENAFAYGGAVQIVDYNDGSIIRRLNNPNDASFANDWFGHSLAAVDTQRLLVGAPRADKGNIDRVGVAYLMDIGSGQILQTFENPSPTENAGFGLEMTVLGDSTVAISAYGAAGIPSNQGQVYLFDIESGDLLRTIAYPGPPGVANFGFSLATINQDLLLVGAEVDSQFGYFNGSAFVFDIRTGEVVDTMRPLGRITQVRFGTSVAVTKQGSLVIGGPESDTSFGRVVIYGTTVPEPTSVVITTVGALAILGLRRKY
ncbi:FG-GAP repeat protein [Aeoliella sp. SH292]|uniref:FG-GAP repeat protein n=1 Tax=Aeoliella sp. SH292 TaxID=3454464 RepID=UPI003F9D1F57